VAITVPDVDDLTEFTGKDYTSYDEDYVDNVLQQSADLFTMATGLTTDQTEELELRVQNYAILSMADYLIPLKDTTSTDMQSERIGSYSYSRMTKEASLGNETGIGWWDRAISFFNSGSATDLSTMFRSTLVFEAENLVDATDGNNQAYLLGPILQQDIWPVWPQ